jgi:CMP-N-acetylneuraminic acid synthetase
MSQKIVDHVPIKEISMRLPRKKFLGFIGEPLYYEIFQPLEEVELINEIYLSILTNE